MDRSSQEVFQYLSNLENFKPLMPDSVSEFEVMGSQANLRVQGLGKFSIEKAEERPSEYLKLLPSGKLPFPFFIEWHLTALSEERTEAYAQVHAELNMFIKMMAQPKLKEFLNAQVEALKTEIESA
jgi:hypothetical protein